MASLAQRGWLRESLIPGRSAILPAGPATPQEPPFPDIYGGNAQLWEAHFRGIGRAYRALGKEDDFAIRVLTEDFKLAAQRLDPTGTRAVPASQPAGCWLPTTYKATVAAARIRTEG